MKSPNSSYKRAKNKAWKWFSKFIRLRDCIKTTGFPDQGKCVTCPKYYPYEEFQAGHAIPGRNMSILFDEKLVNAQCTDCNIKKGGNYKEYKKWYINEYGEDDYNEKKILSKQLNKMSVPELEEKAIEYEERYSKLSEEYPL